MAEIYFDSWEKLCTATEKTLSDILKNDVAPIAENILRKHIKEDIYDAYTPKNNGWVDSQGNPTTYQRRHVLENSIVRRYTTIQGGLELLITSDATASSAIVPGWSFHNRYPGAFLKLLEVGDMGIWRGGFPRPAVKNTQDDIDSSSDIKNAIGKGIKREIGIYVDI